ncbi:MAG: ankyrin repeat domain-containing protein [Spirochaetota bacterium]
MRIVVDLDDRESLARGLSELNEWDRERELIDYQCGRVEDGRFAPFARAAWCGDDGDGRSAFFDAAARHPELHQAIKRYIEWSKGYTYDESGAGIFAALALVIHAPEEVDRAIDHIAQMDLDHEVLEGYHMQCVVEHLGYNETTVRLVAARATVCRGQHGLEDLDEYAASLSLGERADLQKPFSDAVAAFLVRMARDAYDREDAQAMLEDELAETWEDGPYLERLGAPHLAESIRTQAWELFGDSPDPSSQDSRHSRDAVSPTLAEEVNEELARLGADWRAARGQWQGDTPTEQLLDAVGSAYADSSLVFPGAPTEEQVEALIASGAEVNAIDHGGRSPLWLAAGNDLAPACRALIAHGASLERAAEGRTPIAEAMYHHNVEVAMLLAHAGARLDEASWKIALSNLSERERRAVAEVSVAAETACKEAQAYLLAAAGALPDDELAELRDRAATVPDANLRLTTAEAASGSYASIAKRMGTLFSDPAKWEDRSTKVLLPFLFDALAATGKTDEAVALWERHRSLLGDTSLPPRLLPAVLTCYAEANDVEAGLQAISSYAYQVERTWCDKEHCLFDAVVRLTREGGRTAVAHDAAVLLAQNHQSRKNTTEPDPELSLSQLAHLHFSPGSIEAHIACYVRHVAFQPMRSFGLSREDLALTDDELETAGAELAGSLGEAIASLEGKLAATGPVFVVMRLADGERSALEWLTDAENLSIGVARRVNIQEIPFEVEEFEECARTAVGGLGRIRSLGLTPSDPMQEFSADQTVTGPLLAIIYSAVKRLASGGALQRFAPGRPLVVVTDEPIQNVLFVRAE